MPCKSALLAGLALLALLPDAALAQAKKYVSLNAATLDDVNVALDGAVVESYQAGRLVAAEIDTCFPAGPFSYHLDRIKLPLNLAKDGTMSAAGTSLVDNLAVSVTLRRAQKGDVVSLTGVIQAPDLAFKINQPDGSAQAENPIDATIADLDPDNFAPGDLAIRMANAALPGVLAELKAARAQAGTAELFPTCTNLRSGLFDLTATVNPSRLPGLKQKLAAMPGIVVRQLGYNYGLATAIRFKPPAAALDNGKPDAAKLAKLVQGAFLKALKAEADGEPVANDITGEFALAGLRKAELAGAPTLRLRSSMNIIVAAAHDDPAFVDVYLGNLVNRMEETAGEPKLAFRDSNESGGEEGGSSSYGDFLLQAVKRELHGKVWDDDKHAWSAGKP